MRRARTCSFFAACLVALASLHAEAFIRARPHLVPNIEYAVARSALIVRGTIIARDGPVIRVKVLQTLKGPRHEGVELRELYGSREDWRDDEREPACGTEAIIFGRHVNGKQDNPIGETVIPPITLDGKACEFTVDFRMLSKPDEILAAVQAALAYANPGTEDAYLGFSNHNPRRLNWAINLLVCPADPRLEESLHRLIASTTQIEPRLVGVYGLCSFPNDRTRRLLRSLLTDTATESSSEKRSRVRYVVRNAAIRSLESTFPGAKLVPPGLARDEPLLHYRLLALSHAWPLALPVGLVLGFAAARTLLRRRQTSALAEFSIAPAPGFFWSMVSLALAVCVLVLIFRSRHATDELMLALGANHHEIASHDGGLQYMILRQWPTNISSSEDEDESMWTRRPVIGSFDPARGDYWSLSTLYSQNWRTRLGVTVASGRVTGTHRTSDTPWSNTLTYVSLSHPYQFIRISWWLILIPLLLFPSRHLLHIHARHRRRRKGLCPACGYDLRASPERCPECGTTRP